LAKFLKKQLGIEAVQWTGDNIKDIMLLSPGSEVGEGLTDNTLTIKTLEGEMTANLHDWIIRGIKGELYSCKPDIFEKTYDEVKEE